MGRKTSEYACLKQGLATAIKDACEALLRRDWPGISESNNVGWSEMLIAKIVSGGQTGVDRGALEAAVDAGFPYGGLIPKGRLAEDGIVPLKFARMEESTRKDYLHRTEWNVVHSNATLILSFGTELTGGTKRTVEFCKKHNKPYWVEDLNAPRETDRGLEALYWLEAEFGEKGVVLNVAGPRESKAAGIQMSAKTYVTRLEKKRVRA